MDEQAWLTTRFEEQRPRMRAVAYRMLGSVSDADDAVQEAWVRLSRSDTGDVENLGGWLTTVVARISLNMLRSRKTRREDSLEAFAPDPIVGPPGELEPEHEALVADSVGLAMLIVLETLGPAERLAFVLHDVFAVPFDEIAPMLDRTPAATRQLASRARRRIRESAPQPDRSLAAQREIVDAFFAAARGGDLRELVAVLHPDVVLRTDAGPQLTGAEAVAGRAFMFADVGREAHPATINGGAGVIVTIEDRPIALMGFTVVAGRVAAIDVLANPGRLARADLSAVDLGGSGTR